MEHITMPRGDLRNVHFTVHDANDAEVSKGFTQITFTVKENTSSRKVIIQKKLTDGTITKDGNVYSFSIVPEDTDYIDFGTYYYDIELIPSSCKGSNEFGQCGKLQSIKSNQKHFKVRNDIYSNGTRRNNIYVHSTG